MKLYISADIEGVTGICHWNETEKSKADHQKFAEQMTHEVNAACIAANSAGAEEIYIKDAHDSARNIDDSELPLNVKLVRGWSRHPFMMMQEIDESFDAAVMIGYHSPAGSNGNPLAHTMDNQLINYIKINGELASEFTINAYIAALVGVPVVFVSGDESLCESAKSVSKNIKILGVNRGSGNSSISMHPQKAVKLIEENIKNVLKEDLNKYKIELPPSFEVEIDYIHHYHAFKASFYPEMIKKSNTTVVYKSTDYFKVLQMFLFNV